MIPSGRSDAGGAEQSGKMNVCIERSVGFLNQHRMIDYGQQGGIVGTVPDSDAFQALRLVP